MMSWGVTFSGIALVALLLCFGGISGTATSSGWILLVFGVVFALMLSMAEHHPLPK